MQIRPQATTSSKKTRVHWSKNKLTKGGLRYRQTGGDDQTIPRRQKEETNRTRTGLPLKHNINNPRLIYDQAESETRRTNRFIQVHHDL